MILTNAGLLESILAIAIVNSGTHFERFFLIMLALQIVTFIFTDIALRDFHTGSLQIHEQPFIARELPDTSANTSVEDAEPQTNPTLNLKGSARSSLKQSPRNKMTLFGAIFIFAYQGAEVAVSEWVFFPRHHSRRRSFSGRLRYSRLLRWYNAFPLFFERFIPSEWRTLIC